MKKVILYLACSVLFFSCSDSDGHIRSEDNVQLADYSDYPNENTKIELIQTAHLPDNDDLFLKLVADLELEKFELISDWKIEPESSFYDEDKDIQYIVEGDGMKAYYFKRSAAKPENYFPDFTLTCYKFSTDEEANLCLLAIQTALKGGMLPNGKQPQLVVKNGTKVFYLSTRAEMFRGYIEDFGKRIEAY